MHFLLCASKFSNLHAHCACNFLVTNFKMNRNWKKLTETAFVQYKENIKQNKKHFAVPRPLVLPAVAVCGRCKLTSDLDPHGPTPVRVIPIVLKYTNKSKLTFSGYLTIWPQMTSELDLWPLTQWTYEGFHIISINQVWFKSDFNFSNEAIFTFSAYLTTWPQITFDLGTWPLTAWTYES